MNWRSTEACLNSLKWSQKSRNIHFLVRAEVEKGQTDLCSVARSCRDDQPKTSEVHNPNQGQILHLSYANWMEKLLKQLQSRFQPAAVCPRRWCPRSVRLGSSHPPPACPPPAVHVNEASFLVRVLLILSSSSSCSRPRSLYQRFKLFLLFTACHWKSCLS